MSTQDKKPYDLDALKVAQFKFWVKLVGGVVFACLVLMLLWGPVMRPWVQERKGLANLRQAEYENMKRKEQATAESDAAKLRAKAIEIVGAVAKEYPEYRSQELIGGFAKALEQGTINQTYYITTENNIPVLPNMAIPVPAPVTALPQADAPMADLPKTE